MIERQSGLSSLLSLITDTVRPPDRGLVVALTGGGGKTSALFALARGLADGGARVLATTTTAIRDPNAATEREGLGFAPVLALDSPSSPAALAAIGSVGPRLTLGSRLEGGKLRGVEPLALREFARLFDYVLVESDGSRGLPIKAPASHEPALPTLCDIVIGVVGLDALGRPLDALIAHRPELLGPLVACAEGEAIGPAHVARLASSPRGLFKGAPRSASLVVLLNKADLVDPRAGEACAAAVSAAAPRCAVAIGSLGAPERRGRA